MVTGPITKDASTWVVGLMQIRVGASAANIASVTAVLTSVNSIGAMAETALRGNTEFFKQMSGFPKQEDGTIPIAEAFAIECAFKEITPFNLALARGIDPTASLASQIFEVSEVTTAGTETGTMLSDDDGSIDDEWTVVFATATTGAIYGKVTGHIHDFANLTGAMEPANGGDTYFTLPANYFSGTWAADETYVFRTMAGGASAYASAHTGTLGLGGLTSPADIRVEGVYTYPNGTSTYTCIIPRAQAAASVEIPHSEESEAAVPIAFESKNASSDNTSGNAAWDSMPLGTIIFA